MKRRYCQVREGRAHRRRQSASVAQEEKGLGDGWGEGEEKRLEDAFIEDGAKRLEAASTLGEEGAKRLEAASTLEGDKRLEAASTLAAHQAPRVLWRRNSTMYGSVKSWVTAEISSAPIFTSERLTWSFFLLCQNW